VTGPGSVCSVLCDADVVSDVPPAVEANATAIANVAPAVRPRLRLVCPFLLPAMDFLHTHCDIA
jgi:hypothetical protein